MGNAPRVRLVEPRNSGQTENSTESNVVCQSEVSVPPPGIPLGALATLPCDNDAKIQLTPSPASFAFRPLVLAAH